MQLLRDNPTTFYTTLLHDLDELLDYWQDKLLTDKDNEWVLRKIRNVKISIQSNYCQLEQLTKK